MRVEASITGTTMIARYRLLLFWLVSMALLATAQAKAASEGASAVSPSPISQIRTPVTIPTPPAANYITICASANPQDAGLKAACIMSLDYNAAVYAHDKRIMQIEEDQFRTQLGADPWLLVVVIGIVVVGLVLSIAQFVKGFVFARAQPDPENSQIWSLAAGVEIKSSVIGLVILAMSLGFLFLYLKFVYSINPAGG